MSSSSPQAVLLFGAGKRNRTANLLITGQLLYLVELCRHLVENKGFEPFWFPLCKRGKHPKHFHSPYGGSNGSRTHLYTVTVYYTNRYTMKPNNFMSSFCIIPPQRFFYVDIQCILGDSIPASTLQDRHSDQNSLIAVSVATPTFN